MSADICWPKNVCFCLCRRTFCSFNVFWGFLVNTTWARVVNGLSWGLWGRTCALTRHCWLHLELFELVALAVQRSVPVYLLLLFSLVLLVSFSAIVAASAVILAAALAARCVVLLLQSLLQLLLLL